MPDGDDLKLNPSQFLADAYAHVASYTTGREVEMGDLLALAVLNACEAAVTWSFPDETEYVN